MKDISAKTSLYAYWPRRLTSCSTAVQPQAGSPALTIKPRSSRVFEFVELGAGTLQFLPRSVYQRLGIGQRPAFDGLFDFVAEGGQVAGAQIASAALESRRGADGARERSRVVFGHRFTHGVQLCRGFAQEQFDQFHERVGFARRAQLPQPGNDDRINDFLQASPVREGSQQSGLQLGELDGLVDETVHARRGAFLAVVGLGIGGHGDYVNTLARRSIRSVLC